MRVDTDPWSYESRAERRKRELGQFRTLAEKVKQLAQHGPVGIAQARHAVQEANPSPKPTAYQKAQQERLRQRFLEIDRARTPKPTPRLSDYSPEEFNRLSPSERARILGGAKPTGELHTVESATEKYGPITNDVPKDTDDAGRKLSELGLNPNDRQARRAIERGTRKITPGDFFSGEKTLRNFGVDTSGLPAPARAAIDVGAAPATWATLGIGGLPAAGGRLGVPLSERLAARLAQRYGQETLAGTAGLLVGNKASEETYKATGNKYLAGAAGLGTGVLAGGAAFNPRATMRTAGRGIERGSSFEDRVIARLDELKANRRGPRDLTPVDPEELAFGGSQGSYLDEIARRNGGAGLREIPKGRLDEATRTGEFGGGDFRKIRQVESPDEFIARLRESNPDVRLTLTEDKRLDFPVLSVDIIDVPEALRGGGRGSRIMREITTWADKNGYTVRLNADPTIGGLKGTKANVDRLKAWYRQFGFVENKGRNMDYQLSSPFTSGPMYRRPRADPDLALGTGKQGAIVTRRTPKQPDDFSDVLRPRAGSEEAPLGTTLAERALAEKEQTLRRPGALGSRMQGLRDVASVLNPAARMERKPLVAANARAAVQAELETGFAATRERIVAAANRAFRETPEYIGPEDNPIKGTFLDIAQNPQDYRLTPLQRQVLDTIDARNTEQVNVIRSQYGADIGLYTPKNEGGIYLPNLNTNEDVLSRTQRTVESIARKGVSKERVYDTARERALRDKRFIPETDVEALLTQHDNALAAAAGNETFRLGTGGLTRDEVIDQIRPGMRDARDRLRAKVDSLKGKLATAESQGVTAGQQFKASQASIRAVERKMAPLEAKIQALEESGEFGPELSFLTGELRQLRLRAASIGRTGAKAGGRNVKAGTRETALARELDTAQSQLDGLVTKYKAINVEPDYTLNRSTFRYHTPEESQTIDELLRVSNGAFDPLLGAMETARATVLGGDLSPLFIQGGLNVMRAPATSARTIAKMALQGDTGLAQIARQEPELVGLYTRARGRALGNVGREFSGTESLLVKIPTKIGGAKGKAFAEKYVGAEQAMYNVVQRMEYEAWKKAYRLLKGTGADDATAAYEAANAISKSGASLSNLDRGVSTARSQLERTALTSPSFLASPALVVKDATSGLAKLVMGRQMAGRERIALIHATNMAGTVMGLSLASAAIAAKSRNMDPYDAIKEAANPANGSKYFMALQIGDGRSIPIGGPFRSFIKGVTPTYRDGKWRYPDLYQFAGSKLAPVPGTAIDLIRNKDFMGNSITQGADGWEKIMRQVEYAAEGALAPISVGGVAEGIRLGESPADIATKTAGQFLGGNVSAPSPTERLNQVARSRYGRDFYDLEPKQQQAIKDQDPFLWAEAVDKGSAERQESEARKAEYKAYQEADDKALLEGKLSPRKWADNRETRSNELGGRMAQIWKDSGREAKEPWEMYAQKIEESKVNGVPDWDSVRGWLDSQTPAFREQVETNVGLNATPVERLRKKLSNEYYDLPAYRGYTADEARAIDELWTLARSRSRSADDAYMLRALRQVAQGVDPKVYQGARRRVLGLLTTDPRRERWRKANPSGYALIAGQAPLNERQRADIEAMLK